MAPPTDKQPTDGGLPPKTAFEFHRQMVIALFSATFVLSMILALGLILSSVTALMAVAAAGALGGFVSSLRRLYSFQRIFPVDFFEGEHKFDVYLIIYSLIPSLVGAIGAVVLYLIFAADLIRTPMFPLFHLSTHHSLNNAFYNFVQNWQPKQPADYAKALVWGFVAGFSERFVPNLLERLASQGNGQEVGAQPPTGAAMEKATGPEEKS